MTNNSKAKKSKVYLLLILLLLIIGIIFLREEKRDDLMAYIDSFKSGEESLELVNSINIPGLSRLEVYKSNIAVSSENKLSLLDLKGNILLEKSFNYDDPDLYFGKNYIYIVDGSMDHIYMIQEDGEVHDGIKIEKDIFNIMEENTNMLVHLKDEDRESVYIYDKKNILIGDNAFSDENIINYALDGSGKYYALSTLELSGRQLKSKIMLYGPNKEKLYSLPINGEIVLYSSFIKNQELVVLTDKSLYSIKAGKILWERSFSSIKDIYIDNDIYILHGKNLEQLDLDGKTLDKLSLTRDYKKLTPFRSDILLYGDSVFSLISDGQEILSQEQDIDVLTSIKDTIIVLKGDNLSIYKLVKIK